MGMTSVIADQELRQELLDRLASGDLSVPFVPSVEFATIRSIVETPEEVERLVPGSEVESIVELFGRPVLAVRGDSFGTPQSEVWGQRLERARGLLEAAIPAVGRIELKNHPSYAWVGTGWLVASGVVVTNRHVAEVFATRGKDGFVFRQNLDGRRLGARIDFLEEHRQPDESELRVSEILYIEPEPGPDVAFLGIEEGAAGRRPIPLTGGAVEGRDVAVIGYPARDSRIPDPQAMQRIFGNVYDVKRLAPGKLTRVTEQQVEHDASTLGGNSGSVVLDLASGEAVGLHFAGSYRTANYAVPTSVVEDRLSRL